MNYQMNLKEDLIAPFINNFNLYFDPFQCESNKNAFAFTLTLTC